MAVTRNQYSPKSSKFRLCFNLKPVRPPWALEEDTKPHALFKEGLNLLFKSRGLRSWEDLAG
jgi:hypothetical protein